MMKEVTQPSEGRISKVKLALGAASLFFFVIGLKRSFRTDDGREIRRDEADLAEAGEVTPMPGATGYPAERLRNAS